MSIANFKTLLVEFTCGTYEPWVYDTITRACDELVSQNSGFIEFEKIEKAMFE